MHNRRSGMFRRRSNGRGFRRQNNDSDGRRLISGVFNNARGKNNFKPHQSVEKLLERYKLLAKEALSSGDKILSENYLQHADHFTRVLNERESIRREKFSENKSDINSNLPEETKTPNEEISESNLANVSKKENEEEKVSEPQI